MENKSFIYAQSTESGHGPVYRNIVTKESGQLVSTLESKATLYETLQAAITRFGDRICFGSRRVIGMVDEVKKVDIKVDGEIQKVDKKWSYYHLSGYEWITFNELSKQLTELGAGLKKLGLGKDNMLAIYAPTSRYWSAIANSCYTQSIAAITVYDNLGTDGLRHGLNECEVSTLFCSSGQLPIVAKILNLVPTLQHIIYHDELNPLDKEAILIVNDKIEFYSFDELMELGRANPSEHNPPKPEDVALIMYTSGTTGQPKGAIIKHSNIVAIMGGLSEVLNDFLNLDDTNISFLPLAHILAFAVDCYMLQFGVRVGYASPRTLLDTSVRNCKGDLSELKPTLIIGVPQVYDSIRKGILNKVNSSGHLSRSLFGWAIVIKDYLSYYGVPTFPIDSLVFNKVKEATGGRLRFAITGGAPCSETTRLFFSTTVCTLLQGYGLTEVCGVAYVTTPDMILPSSSGQCTPCNEFKLVDVPEANYLHTSTPPRGELWIRGNSVISGYYKNDQATQEAFTKDGWFKTGDVAEILPNGAIAIIDRKKNLVKLSNGEYIALEKLEGVYKNILHVQNICIQADSLKPRIVALVQPNLDALNHTLKEQNQEIIFDLTEASQSPIVKKLIKDALVKEAKDYGFCSAEIIADIFITPQEWTADNGLLTSSQKLKRRPLAQIFEAEIQDMMSKL